MFYGVLSMYKEQIVSNKRPVNVNIELEKVSLKHIKRTKQKANLNDQSKTFLEFALEYRFLIMPTTL